MEDSVGEDKLKSNFTAREYQIELFEKAVKRNTIIFLPTGSGKTFIATMVIKHKSKDIEKKFSEGGLRTFFLVNTVALVEQQAESLENQLPFSIGRYSGELNVDNWDHDRWFHEMEEHQILVMTAQIFLNMLLSSFIQLERVNLIIFDECHHAVNKHSMRQIMELFQGLKKKPHVLGLTATLLNGNVKAEKIFKEIHELEVTLQATIARGRNEEMIKSFSTNPQELIIFHESPPVDSCNSIIERHINRMLQFLIAFKFDVHKQEEPPPKHGLQPMYDKSSEEKHVRNMLNEIKVVCADLGGYSAKYALLSKLVSLERLRLSCGTANLQSFYSFIVTSCYEMRKELQEVMDNGCDPSLQAFKYSTPKLKKLFQIFRNYSGDLVTLVFVTRRITAKVLYYVFEDLIKLEGFEGVRPDFIVGVNAYTGSTIEGLLHRGKNKIALKRFNSKETNLLFASDVVEEGLDVQHCNYVIKFDYPATFCSYIQSKGRARHRDSKYIMFVEENFKEKFNVIYRNYQLAEDTLSKGLCHGMDELRSEVSEEEAMQALCSDITPFAPFGKNGPMITVNSAISLLNRYCQMLPQDKFTKLTVKFWKEVENLRITVYIRLPINCPLREVMKGLPCDNIDVAKASAALETCKRLYYVGELNCNLLPTGNVMKVEDFRICPLWKSGDSTKDGRPGSKKRRRGYERKFPTWMCNCKPVANKPSYIHLLRITPTYVPAQTNRHLVFYNLLKSSSNFAILSSNQWPKICDFPLFMNVGEVKVEVVVNMTTVCLSENQLNEILHFHELLFTQALAMKKKYLVKDFDNTENSYCIIPVIDKNQRVNIDWETIRNHKSIPEPMEIPVEERVNVNLTKEMYHGKVVIPWYRPVGFMLKYVVTKVCENETPLSPFPSENFTSYAHYFSQRYNQRIVNVKQPLLEVRAISSKNNCLLPRGKSRHGKRRRRDEDDLEETLVPELCTLVDFPSVYMLKVTLIPSIMHRIMLLLFAEQIRQQIALSLQLGRISLPKGMKWDPLKVDLTAIGKSEEGETTQRSTIQVSNMLADKMDSLIPKDFPWDKDEEPCDIERNIKTVDLLTIKHYNKFAKRSLDLSFLQSNQKPPKLDDVPIPKINILLKHCDSFGPQLSEVHKVIISVCSNDIVNYERIETLGDSFLKYFVSLILFVYFPLSNEGKLTHLKGEIIGNRNLFYCGNNLQLGSVLKVTDFTPDDWDVPYFGVLQSMRDLMREARLVPAALFHVSFSKLERETGILSEKSCQNLLEAFSNSQETEDGRKSTSAIYGQQLVPDKVIADSIEALIGVYLEGCGIEGAAKLCKWLQIVSPQYSDVSKLLLEKPPTACLVDDENINFYLIMPNMLEESLGYKFKDRSFLLQALTHSSYNHQMTDCYQRLEFLGDAILDFLITSYIYENCSNLNPGDLTDLRSALVNNVTFACLAVRSGFHKYLLMKACKLTELVNNFVSHQERRQHRIGAEVLFLIEEEDVSIGELVDVPKVLGDVFESLAGAVYLDSGKSLETVWAVFYRLMHKEIEEFSKDVPKNNIRLLYEKFPSPLPIFGKATACEFRGVIVPLHVTHNNELKTFHGVGENKKQAKLAAAKVALRYYHNKGQQYL